MPPDEIDREIGLGDRFIAGDVMPAVYLVVVMSFKVCVAAVADLPFLKPQAPAAGGNDLFARNTGQVPLADVPGAVPGGAQHIRDADHVVPERQIVGHGPVPKWILAGKQRAAGRDA